MGLDDSLECVKTKENLDGVNKKLKVYLLDVWRRHVYINIDIPDSIRESFKENKHN